MPKTRKDAICPVFGAPTKFKDNVLPTFADVIKYYLWIRLELLQDSGKEPSMSVVSEKILERLKNIWYSSSVPTVSDQQILHLIREYHKKYRSVKKNFTSKYNTKCLEKMEIFKVTAENKLFIAACKCKDFSSCYCKNKIPAAERDFLLDQRTSRKMVIGRIDFKTTKELQKKIVRKAKKAERHEKHQEFMQQQKATNLPLSQLDTAATATDSDKESESVEDFENEPCTSNVLYRPSTSQMRLQLPSLAQACDRTGISDRSAAIIVSAVLKDVGIVTKEDPSKIVDRSKIRQESKVVVI